MAKLSSELKREENGPIFREPSLVSCATCAQSLRHLAPPTILGREPDLGKERVATLLPPPCTCRQIHRNTLLSADADKRWQPSHVPSSAFLDAFHFLWREFYVSERVKFVHARTRPHFLVPSFAFRGHSRVSLASTAGLSPATRQHADPTPISPSTSGLLSAYSSRFAHFSFNRTAISSFEPSISARKTLALFSLSLLLVDAPLHPSALQATKQPVALRSPDDQVQQGTGQRRSPDSPPKPLCLLSQKPFQRKRQRRKREKQLKSCLQQLPSVDECHIQRLLEKQAMLPYQTLHEAQDSLGRPLTFAETLWFNYSARMPDFLLYFHNFLFLLCVFSLCPLPVALVELKGPKFLDRFKIQPKVRTPLHIMLKCYKDVMVVFFFVVGPLQLSSYPLIKLVGIRMGLPLPSVWEMLAQLLVYFLVEDYGNYWLHRWMHNKWGYEKIHHVHHEYTAPIGFAAPYAHWAEVLVLGIPAFVGPAIVPGHIVTFWLWIALRQMEAIETHSGYDFPWSLTKFIPFYGGAEYHDYHHYVGGLSQSNFASVFTYCDYIYGTDKGYRYHRYQKAQLGKMKDISFGEVNGKSNKADQDPKSQ